MAASRTDDTNLFRRLSGIKRDDTTADDQLREEFVDRERLERWLQDCRARLPAGTRYDAERQVAMNNTNPRYVLRNYMALIAIENARAGDYSKIDRQLKILLAPFDEHPDMAHYAESPPDWDGGIQVSCSS